MSIKHQMIIDKHNELSGVVINLLEELKDSDYEPQLINVRDSLEYLLNLDCPLETNGSPYRRESEQV